MQDRRLLDRLANVKASLAVRAVNNAVAMRENVNGCVVHSGRGSQRRSRNLRRTLTRQNLVGSMGRVASCGENAAMAFFNLLQKSVPGRGPGPRVKNCGSRS